MLIFFQKLLLEYIVFDFVDNILLLGTIENIEINMEVLMMIVFADVEIVSGELLELGVVGVELVVSSDRMGSGEEHGVSEGSVDLFAELPLDELVFETLGVTPEDVLVGELGVVLRYVQFGSEVIHPHDAPEVVEVGMVLQTTAQ